MSDVASFVPVAQYGTQAINPAGAILSGIQGGVGIQEAQNQLTAQQLAIEQQAQMQKDLTAFAAKPNPQASDYSALMARYPQLADKFKSSYDVMNAGQQQEQLKNTVPVLAALRNGNVDAANQVLDQQITAYQNSGNTQGVAGATAMKHYIAIDPKMAQIMVGMNVAATQPDKFGDILNSMTTQAHTEAMTPIDVAKGKAEASSATTKAATDLATAPVAVQQASANLAKTQQETAASELAGRISGLNTQIAQANSETERGKLELERDKLVQQQKQTQTAQGQATQDSINSANQALDTVNQIKAHPGLDAFFTGPGTTWGAIWGKVPGSDRNALQGWVDSLKGQLGFQNLMAAKQSSPTGASGFGALSEGELRMLSGLAGNLDLNSADFPKVLGKVETYLNKAQAKQIASPNLPTAGGAFVANSPKYGVITEGRVNQVLQQNPGATRADVLRFLGVGQ